MSALTMPALDDGRPYDDTYRPYERGGREEPAARRRACFKVMPGQAATAASPKAEPAASARLHRCLGQEDPT